MTDAEDLLLEIANSMSKDFVDPAEHANWCMEAAKEYFTSGPMTDANMSCDELLDTLWGRINAIGGPCGEYDDHGHGINYAVQQATDIIEDLGGMAPLKRKAIRDKTTEIMELHDKTVAMLNEARGATLVHITPNPDACDHDFTGWRPFSDGNGGERVCSKCGMGAMAYTLRTGI